MQCIAPSKDEASLRGLSVPFGATEARPSNSLCLRHLDFMLPVWYSTPHGWQAVNQAIWRHVLMYNHLGAVVSETQLWP
jgi:hypothetical protein